jgi:hypothetical protein
MHANLHSLIEGAALHYSEGVTKKAQANGRLELPRPGSPASPLGRKLMRLRKEIESSGVRLLSSAGVRRKVLRRRGLA